MARLSHAERQKDFVVTHKRTRNMPLGDYMLTEVHFKYVDPEKGEYLLRWRLQGKHDPDFLRLDEEERAFQLAPYGPIDGEYPPRLAIRAVEGVKPW